MPRLTKIAHVDFDPTRYYLLHVKVLPGMVIWSHLNGVEDRTVFKVWDYRLNHSRSFSGDIDVGIARLGRDVYFIFFQSDEISF
jgi:hypothetical protein